MTVVYVRMCLNPWTSEMTHDWQVVYAKPRGFAVGRQPAPGVAGAKRAHAILHVVNQAVSDALYC